MLAVERRLKILDRVAQEQTIAVAELAREFNVSEMTIRRDIHRLERDGFVRRTYGGAIAHAVRSVEVGFNARMLQHSVEKRLIGREAARLAGDARVLFLGTGTTAEQFARYLVPRPDLTVITASLSIASLLGTRHMKTVVVGGTVRQDELSCVGPLAIDGVRRYNTELAVVGAGGISARRGITELEDAETEVFRAALEQTDRAMVIADGSKFGAVAMSTVTPIGRIHTIVTDTSASPTEVREIQSLGVQVVMVSPEQTDGAALSPDAEATRKEKL
jgi:DeoR family transcriptional regulator of aga operon/DeoR family fructose operon transcriptional repressor